jgi:hypothetical protein
LFGQEINAALQVKLIPIISFLLYSQLLDYNGQNRGIIRRIIKPQQKKKKKKKTFYSAFIVDIVLQKFE